MLTPVRKLGNASGVMIPKRFLDEIGARQGETVDLRVEGSRLVITRSQTHPREGWAKASLALAD